MSVHIPAIALYIQSLRGPGSGATLIRGAGGVFLVNVLGIGLMFVAHVLLARLIDASSYGNFAYALTWLNVLVLFGKLGLDTASLRFVAEYNGTGQWGLMKGFVTRSSQVALAGSLLVAVATAAVLWIFRYRLNPELFTVFGLLCLILPLYSLLLVRSAALRGLKKVVKAHMAIRVVRPLVLMLGLGGLYFSVKSALDATAAMTMEMIAISLSLLFVAVCFQTTFPGQAVDAYPEYKTSTWIRVAFPMLLISAMMQTQNQADVLIMGFFLEPAQVGVYAAAKKVTMFIALGLGTINIIAAPLISELWHQNRKKELQRILTLAARGIFVFTLPVSLFMIIFRRSVLALFGPEFIAGSGPLVILAVGQLINSLAGALGLIMNMTGHQNQLAITVAISLSLNILLGIILIPSWGIYGAALSMTISLIGWNLMMYIYVLRRLKLNSFVLNFVQKDESIDR